MNGSYLSLLRTAPLAIALAACVAMGCASGPPIALKAQLAQTDTSIAQAEQSGAAKSGLVELQQAKDKRARAQEALDDHKYDLAMQYAQQAQLDAQFASRKSEAERITRTAIEIRKGHETLREETERNLDNQPVDTTTRPLADR